VGLIDRIDVQNDPVNFIDPEGLVSYGQLGIGNPGSYGGENDCDKLYDDLPGALEYKDNPYRVDPEEIIGMLPIGGAGSIAKKASVAAGQKIGVLLRGTGQIPALLRNKNLKGVDTQGLLDKTLSEAKGLLSKKQYKTLMKHFEGRDLRHGQ
jgi:hypothetical protein